MKFEIPNITSQELSERLFNNCQISDHEFDLGFLEDSENIADSQLLHAGHYERIVIPDITGQLANRATPEMLFTRKMKT